MPRPSDRDRNARVIIPFALLAWLGGILVFQDGVPELLRALFVASFAVSVPVVVFSLMARAGWSELAERHRTAAPFGGPWRSQPTAVMSHVGLDDPAFRSQQLRFIGGTLRVGVTAEALHLSTQLSRVPLLGLLFPELRLPWSEVRSARTYEAPGWYAPQREPGVLVQAAYDPNYTGTFVELAVGAPPVYLILPAGLLGDALLSRLPAPS